MKVLLAVVLTVVSVSARGSGPYLPSGWRPSGPAFYLPSEIASKPADNPLRETILQESEASGSEGLREYGPPKLQEVSNDVGDQGLPIAVNGQDFQVTQVKIEQAVEEKVATQAIAEKTSVVSEVQEVTVAAVEEINSTTESAVIEKKNEAIAAVEEKEFISVGPIVVNDQPIVVTLPSVEEKTEQVSTLQPVVEEATEIIAVQPVQENTKVIAFEPIVVEEEEEVIVSEPVVVEEITSLVTEPVVVEEQSEAVVTEPAIVEEKSIFVAEPIVVEEKTEVAISEALLLEEKSALVTEPVVVEEKVQTVEEEQTYKNVDVNSKVEVELSTQISPAVEETSELNTDAGVTELVQSAPTVTSLDTTAVVVNVESGIKSEVATEELESNVQQVTEGIKTEVQKVEELNTVVEEEVKSVQGEVQNIADALVVLENEAKAEQIQTEVKLSQEISGSLEQVPEGFLEYGPPGFREYGPPKGDELLRAAVLEAISAEPGNELRKRRFSPKFRSTKKH